MANRKIVLVRYCKTQSGWKRYPAVIGKTGKVKPAAVWVGDEIHEYPHGSYQLRMYRGRKLIYEPVGTDPSEALAARDYREKEIAAAITALTLVKDKIKGTPSLGCLFQFRPGI